MSAPAKPWRPTGRGDTYQSWLRQQFLRELAKLVPDASAGLEAARPLYAEYMAGVADDAHSMTWALRGVRHAAERGDVSARALLDVLATWAEPYALHRDEWITEYVLHHLWRAWRSGEAEPLGTWAAAMAMQHPRRTAPIYIPAGETRAEYMGRVAAYVEDVEADYRASGFAETPAKRSELDHLKWLVRHQCLGWSYDKCAALVGADPRSVRRAVDDMVALLPLALRPARGRRVK